MDLISLLGIVFSGIGIFLSSFYLLRNKLKNDGYLFLYLALVLISYEVFYKTLVHSRLIYDFLVLYYPARFFNLLIYPIFLFFIWTITRKDFKLNGTHWLLLLVFMGYTVYTFGYALGISNQEKKHLLDLFYQDKRPGPYNYWGNWPVFIKSTLIPLLLLSIMAYDFFQFRKRNAGLQSKRLLNFLSLIIALYFIFYQSSNLIYSWAYWLTDVSMIEWPVDILFLSIIILLLSIVTLSVNSGDSFFPHAKYATSRLDKKDYARIVAKAQDILESEQLFKNTQLTIADLSGQLSINPKYLSQAINDYLDLSFVDFINQYRVEEAKVQLLNEENRSLTIEAIGQMVGFKSKSSFFRAFKKNTNYTPNQFIKSVETTGK